MQLTINLENDNAKQLYLAKKIIEEQLRKTKYGNECFEHFEWEPYEDEDVIKVKKAINNLIDKMGPTFPIEDINEEATKMKMSSDQINSVIEEMKKRGDIFEPREGFISKI